MDGLHLGEGVAAHICRVTGRGAGRSMASRRGGTRHTPRACWSTRCWGRCPARAGSCSSHQKEPIIGEHHELSSWRGFRPRSGSGAIAHIREAPPSTGASTLSGSEVDRCTDSDQGEVCPLRGVPRKSCRIWFMMGTEYGDAR